VVLPRSEHFIWKATQTDCICAPHSEKFWNLKQTKESKIDCRLFSRAAKNSDCEQKLTALVQSRRFANKSIYSTHFLLQMI
jgi:hypothetical protein